MIFNFTESETEQQKEISKQFVKQHHLIQEAIEHADNQKIKQELLARQKLLYEETVNKMIAFNDTCERNRFREIATSTESILKHAEDAAPLYIKMEYESSQNAVVDEKFKKSYFQAHGILYKNGQMFISKHYAKQLLYGEFYLHIEALKDDKEALQKLFNIIAEAVKNSPYTDDETEPLAVAGATRPPLKDISTYGLMNDKASAQLMQDTDLIKTEPNGQLTLRWMPTQDKDGQIPTYIALTYQGTDGKVSKKLSAFDEAVYNAVSTRFYYWQLENSSAPLYITPQEIWRTMNGKQSGDGTAKPSAAQVRRIRASLDMMRFTRIYLDISEEIKAKYIKVDDERLISGKIDTYLLNASEITFTTEKGKRLTGYQIDKKPILYAYNEMKHHVLYVPYEMLDTSEGTSDGENVTEIRFYLLHQIQLIKNYMESKKGYKRSNTILLETIYKYTGIPTPEERIANKIFKTDASKQKSIRQERKKDRDKIEGMLETWKAKGWIKGYKPVKKGSAITGYGISV